MEKYFRAYLVWTSVAFPIPRTHEVEELLSLMPEKSRPALSIEEQNLLTESAADLKRYIVKETSRRPLIMPVILEV